MKYALASTGAFTRTAPGSGAFEDPADGSADAGVAVLRRSEEISAWRFGALETANEMAVLGSVLKVTFEVQIVQIGSLAQLSETGSGGSIVDRRC